MTFIIILIFFIFEKPCCSLSFSLSLSLFLSLSLSLYIYIYVDDNIYMLPYPSRIDLSREWSNCVAISVYARLFIWIELSVAIKRIYVNNNNYDS